MNGSSTFSVSARLLWEVRTKRMAIFRQTRSFRSVVAFGTLVAMCLWWLASVGPLSAQPLELPLGLATGTGESDLSEDGRKWTTLTPVSRLILDETMIRTGNGLAWAPLHDATQFELHQCGVVGVYGSRPATVLKIAVGRVLFRLPAISGTVLATPNVRFQVLGETARKTGGVVRVGAVAPSSSDRIGWIIVDGGGNSNSEQPRWKTRIEMLQGSLLATPANGRGPQLIEAGQTVDFLENPRDPDPDFKTLLDQRLACPCLPCVAVLPAVVAFPVFPALPVVAGAIGILGGGVGFLSGATGPSPLPPASPSAP